MTIRFVTPAMHGIVDYLAGIGLIIVPRILGLGESSPHALTLWTVVGVAAILSAVLTRYRLGILKWIPYKTHLIIDLVVGALFIVTPSLLRFKGLDMYYCWFNAVALTLVVTVSQREEDPVNPKRWW